MKKHTWKIVGIIAVLAIVGSIIYSGQVAKKANQGVEITEHIKGNPNAEAVLIEYSDFECPACAQFYPYIKQAVEEAGDRLRFEYRHFPLITIHQQAVPAARAAEAAAQQGKFWEMHDMLFENQSEWSKSTNPKSYFTQYAEELGLDTDKFQLHMNSSVIDDAITDGFNEARELGFTGTPSFLLNGEKMEFSTFDEFLQQIEDAINQSNTEVSS